MSNIYLRLSLIYASAYSVFAFICFTLGMENILQKAGSGVLAVVVYGFCSWLRKYDFALERSVRLNIALCVAITALITQILVLFILFKLFNYKDFGKFNLSWKDWFFVLFNSKTLSIYAFRFATTFLITWLILTSPKLYKK